jgi:inosine-uridine nucleoside N-ribohydrolase
MTNLGALARAGHPLPPITAMGGKVADVLLPGIIPQISEWNWWCDPSAVVSGLSGPQRVPPRIVPVEVTFRTSLAADDRARLGQGDALARQLARLCDHWLEAQRDRFGAKEPGVKLHDPLAAVTLVERGLVSFEPRRIRVEEDGGARPDPQGIPVDVAGAVDNSALCEHLMAVWLG